MDSAQRSPSGVSDEKPAADHKEALHEETSHEVAEGGHVATDQYGLSFSVGT